MSARGGFTLVEVLLIVVIGIILASAAIPNLSTFADQQVGADARVLAADLEFARARAIATSQQHRVLFDATNNTYSVESPPGTLLTEPLGKKPWQRKLMVRGSGTDLVSADFNGQSAVIFDAAGTPNNGGTTVLKRGSFQAKVIVTGVTGEVSLELP